MNVNLVSSAFTSMLLYGDLQNFKKFGKHLNFIGTKRETWRKFHSEQPQILDTNAYNLVEIVTWHPGIVQFCCDTLF
jgi:hypothetical protein